MKKAWIAALFALALPSATATRVSAQDMEFSLDDSGDGADMSFSEDGGSGSSDDDVIGSLASEGEASGAEARSAERDAPTRSEEAHEEIYAVQQIYALRINRVELTPSFSASLNDPFYSHNGLGLGLNFWFTNVLAVGLSFLWYEGLGIESDINFQVRRSTRLAVPINEYQLGAHLSFTYVPVYGKFAMFNEFIFQYDVYVMGGVGLMRTRPIPVVDPEVRRFDFGERIAFNVGIGLRVFVTRWLAIFAELRDYMYLETLESLEVALGADRDDPATWTQSSPAFVNNVTAHIGLAVFIPFEFDYRLPR